jgi:SAM-dependent methyltransferase
VVGIDISEKMLEVAKRETSGVEYIHADMSDLLFIKENFDVVFSSLAVHYIEDFGKLCTQVYALLNPGGCFIFSQEHPFTTAPLKGPCWSKNEKGERLHYNLSDYQRVGRRETTWIVEGVIKYHRTFSGIVNNLVAAGFSIERMTEPAPVEELVARLPSYASELHKPSLLLVENLLSLHSNICLILTCQRYAHIHKRARTFPCEQL